jgi:hypothetical protein
LDDDTISRTGSSDEDTQSLIRRLYEEPELYERDLEQPQPLSQDPTGGLRFRKNVPEALLHLDRNNRAALERLASDMRIGKSGLITTLQVKSGKKKTNRDAFVSLLYWHSSFSIELIAWAFGLQSGQVKKIAKANQTAIFRCLDCDEVLSPNSRQHFRKMWEAAETLDCRPDLLKECLYTGLHCEACIFDREDRWGEEYYRQEREYQKEVMSLRAMDYNEYLRTEHWMHRREQKLRQAEYRCEMCHSSSVQLDVHHLTYDRLGEELDKDLRVLCRGCHVTFHKYRRLGR